MSRPIKNYCDYFPHDAGMRNHKKVKALRSKFGITGYTVWSMILEYLTGSDGNVFPYTDMEFELMSGDFGVSATEIRGVVDYCITMEMLFNENGFVKSESLDERLAPVYEKRNKSKELSKQQQRTNGKFASNNTDSHGQSVAETPQMELNGIKSNGTKKIIPDSYESEISVLEIIRSLKSEALNRNVIQYKLTPERIRVIRNRKKEFDKVWPNRDFLKACAFAFKYKSKEWAGKETFQYFEPETLLSKKFVSYVEKAEQDKGEPYVGEPKKKEEEKVYYQIPK